MKWQIEQLSQHNALIIANQWHYSGEYAFYNLKADPEDYQEIVTPELRGNHYYQVVDENEQLVGVVAIEPVDLKNNVYEFGLGLTPELTGQGLGESFLNCILNYVRHHFSAKTIILDVAEFNIRAQKVYKKLGFQPIRKHMQKTNRSVYPFIEMRRDFND